VKDPNDGKKLKPPKKNEPSVKPVKRPKPPKAPTYDSSSASESEYESNSEPESKPASESEYEESSEYEKVPPKSSRTKKQHRSRKRQQIESEYSSSEEENKPSKVRTKTNKTTTKYHPVDRYSSEEEVEDESGEFDEKVIYKHFKNGSLANDSYIMEKRSMIRPQRQEQISPPVVNIYHCYPQRSYNQQIELGNNHYRQEQIGWPVNDCRVVCTPPQQEQRHQCRQPSYCHPRRVCCCQEEESISAPMDSHIHQHSRRNEMDAGLCYWNNGNPVNCWGRSY